MNEVILIRNAGELSPHLPQLMAAKTLGVDLETTGLDPTTDRVRLVQLAIEAGPTLVIDCATFLPDGMEALRAALAAPAVKVLQNAKFDLQFLLALGIQIAPVFDTMLAARLLFMPGMPSRSNLETLAEYYLDETIDKTEQTSDWGGELSEAQLRYAARDAEILPRLRRVMAPRLVEAGLTKIAEIEFMCVQAVARMEYRGIALDVPRWRALMEEETARRDAALEGLYAFTGRPMAQTTLWGEDEVLGINFDSNATVLSLLREQGIVVDGTSKGELYPYRQHPLVIALTAYRKAAKALSAILLPVLSSLHPATGRLHPHYMQIGAYSGRMSCGNPNIQQIPRDRAFRDCFRAPVGRRLVLADYSQIELRVAAQISGDERMLAAYRRGEDLHRLTASLVTGKMTHEVTAQERQAAKAVNFGLIYGMGAPGLHQYAQQSYGVDMSLEQATLFRRRFFEAYPGIGAWHQRLKDYPPTEGRTLTGRRFPLGGQSLPELSNSPVQGTAADILKRALGLLVPRLEAMDAWIVGVVHDEILLECAEEAAPDVARLLARTMMEAGADILPLVPVEADAHIAQSWAEK